MFKIFFILSFAFLLFISNNFSQSNGLLLYSQSSTVQPTSVVEAISSDKYYPSEPNYECQTADDFIAIEDWSIYQIIVSGTLDANISADGFNVYVYSNENNKPGSIVYSAASQSYSVEANLFTIQLTNPIELTAGHYWICVQAYLNWNNAAYDGWVWNQVIGTYNVEAEYQNPVYGNGNGVGFSWTPVRDCWNVQKTDMYFELYGASITSVKLSSLTPSTYSLEQNYPNPFNPSTKISWQSPVAGHQTLKVYDVLGNEIATLMDEYRPVGRYEVEFNASNLSSGTYFYQLKVGDFVQTKKMILIK